VNAPDRTGSWQHARTKVGGCGRGDPRPFCSQTRLLSRSRIAQALHKPPTLRSPNSGGSRCHARGSHTTTQWVAPSYLCQRKLAAASTHRRGEVGKTNTRLPRGAPSPAWNVAAQRSAGNHRSPPSRSSHRRLLVAVLCRCPSLPHLLQHFNVTCHLYFLSAVRIKRCSPDPPRRRWDGKSSRLQPAELGRGCRMQSDWGIGGQTWQLPAPVFFSTSTFSSQKGGRGDSRQKQPAARAGPVQ
jgi:hypothetical protein